MSDRLIVVAGPARYTSRIIKAGALLPDTKLLLATWDESATVKQNLAHARQANLFGKASRSRVEDILAIFRQRYLVEPALLRALVILVKGGLPDQALDRVLYVQAVRADALLQDTVTELLAPRAERGQREVAADDVTRWLDAQIAAGRMERPWNDETRTRVAQGLLATLRDFGVLEGATTKRITAPFVPVSAFSFLAFQLSRAQSSGERLVTEPAWRVFFLSRLAVERLFGEAHQQGLLQYYAAGSVIRIEFPTRSVEEYARALLARPY